MIPKTHLQFIQRPASNSPENNMLEYLYPA